MITSPKHSAAVQEAAAAFMTKVDRLTEEAAVELLKHFQAAGEPLEEAIAGALAAATGGLLMAANGPIRAMAGAFHVAWTNEDCQRLTRALKETLDREAIDILKERASAHHSN
jgi:hypothetical protein